MNSEHSFICMNLCGFWEILWIYAKLCQFWKFILVCTELSRKSYEFVWSYTNACESLNRMHISLRAACSVSQTEWQTLKKGVCMKLYSCKFASNFRRSICKGIFSWLAMVSGPLSSDNNIVQSSCPREKWLRTGNSCQLSNSVTFYCVLWFLGLKHSSSRDSASKYLPSSNLLLFYISSTFTNS